MEKEKPSNKKTKQKFLLLFLIILLFAINYPFLDKALKNWIIDYEVGIIERVIDGDTVVINRTSVRLLGINSPEKGEVYYEKAKEFLENLTLHMFVKLKKDKEDLDKYKRKLRYVFVDGKNVNLEMVKKGFANFYFPSGKDKYYNEFRSAWEKCVGENKNLCEKSEEKCAGCIELKKFDYENEIIIFYNKCEFNCELTGWEIKDEGRKNFIFPKFVLEKEVKIIVGRGEDEETILFWRGEDYVWTETGDTLFLRDGKGKLVLWWSY